MQNKRMHSVCACTYCSYDWNIVKPVLRLKMDQVSRMWMTMAILSIDVCPTALTVSQVLAEYENTWPDCADGMCPMHSSDLHYFCQLCSHGHLSSLCRNIFLAC